MRSPRKLITRRHFWTVGWMKSGLFVTPTGCIDQAMYVILNWLQESSKEYNGVLLRIKLFTPSFWGGPVFFRFFHSLVCEKWVLFGSFPSKGITLTSWEFFVGTKFSRFIHDIHRCLKSMSTCKRCSINMQPHCIFTTPCCTHMLPAIFFSLVVPTTHDRTVLTKRSQRLERQLSTS